MFDRLIKNNADFKLYEYFTRYVKGEEPVDFLSFEEMFNELSSNASYRPIMESVLNFAHGSFSFSGIDVKYYSNMRLKVTSFTCDADPIHSKKIENELRESISAVLDDEDTDSKVSVFVKSFTQQVYKYSELHERLVYYYTLEVSLGNESRVFLVPLKYTSQAINNGYEDNFWKGVVILGKIKEEFEKSKIDFYYKLKRDNFSLEKNELYIDKFNKNYDKNVVSIKGFDKDVSLLLNFGDWKFDDNKDYYKWNTMYYHRVVIASKLESISDVNWFYFDFSQSSYMLFWIDGVVFQLVNKGVFDKRINRFRKSYKEFSVIGLMSDTLVLVDDDLSLSSLSSLFPLLVIDKVLPLSRYILKRFLGELPSNCKALLEGSDVFSLEELVRAKVKYKNPMVAMIAEMFILLIRDIYSDRVREVIDNYDKVYHLSHKKSGIDFIKEVSYLDDWFKDKDFGTLDGFVYLDDADNRIYFEIGDGKKIYLQLSSKDTQQVNNSDKSEEFFGLCKNI